MPTQILEDTALYTRIREWGEGWESVRIDWKPGTEPANADALRARADAAIASMQAHVDRGTFTTTQRDAALLLVLRVAIALCRLTLGRLEAS